MELQATHRTVLGKKVRALRRQGVTPVHLFGRDMASQALQVASTDLQRLLKTAGRNALVDLAVQESGKRKDTSYKVMVRDIQKNPITGQVLHVDLYRVLLTERMEVEVPVVLVGIAPAVDRNQGTLVQSARTIHVEGLPGTLPSVVEVDISGLEEAHQAIHAKDIALPAGTSLASDPDLVIANVVPRRGISEAEEAEAAAEAAGAPTAAGQEAESKENT